MLDPDQNFTWDQNKAFIKSAIQNGDHFMVMRHPGAWNDYTTNVYGQGSRLVNEIQVLQGSGISTSRIHKMF